MNPEFGIVCFDLGGGDVAFHFVDRARWDQILGVYNSEDESQGWKDRMVDTIGWLTADDRSETDPPSNAPVRVGTLIGTRYTQTFAMEPVSGVTGSLIGILTFP